MFPTDKAIYDENKEIIVNKILDAVNVHISEMLKNNISAVIIKCSAYNGALEAFLNIIDQDMNSFSESKREFFINDTKKIICESLDSILKGNLNEKIN